MGKVDQYLNNEIESEGAIHISLIDPEEAYRDTDLLRDILERVKVSGSKAIMVGGSTIHDRDVIEYVISHIRDVTSLPIILFPNDITSVTGKADAIWFMSLLNSINPYFITGAQMRAAPVIRKLGLEPLPMAYIIVGEGKTAGYMGYANPIPEHEPSIAAAYALAAEYMGFKYVYLEAGSGASKRVDPTLIRTVKSILSHSRLVVGGGIRSYRDAYDAAFNGADIIVTGNILEEDPDRLFEIVEGVREGGRNRLFRVEGET